MKLADIEYMIEKGPPYVPADVRKAVAALRKSLAPNTRTTPERRAAGEAMLAALAGRPGYFEPGAKAKRTDPRSAVDNGMEGLIARQRNALMREAEAWKMEDPFYVQVTSAERPRMLALMDLEAGGLFEITERSTYFVEHARVDPLTGKRPQRQRITAKYLGTPEDDDDEGRI